MQGITNIMGIRKTDAQVLTISLPRAFGILMLFFVSKTMISARNVNGMRKRARLN
jgi:hypothetical protein